MHHTTASVCKVANMRHMWTDKQHIARASGLASSCALGIGAFATEICSQVQATHGASPYLLKLRRMMQGPPSDLMQLSNFTHVYML